MFSQLGPLFKTTFRQAESNDTRQKIPHEERDNNRKKQNEDGKSENHVELWEDNTSVSIDALRAFLINFLKDLPEAQGLEIPNQSTNNAASVRPKEATRPTSTKNAKAVRAYQAQAAHTHETPSPKAPEEDKSKPATIENKEMRDIYKLIDSLEQLSNRGVQMLTIEKSGDFLTSLRHSVQKIL